MKTEAEKLIERMEKETGQRVDDPNGMAITGLLGAMARLSGNSTHDEKDDLIAGIVIQGKREEQNDPK